MNMLGSEAVTDYGELFRLCDLRKEHLVYPVFVSEKKKQIHAMPGLAISSIDDLEEQVQQVTDRGIGAIILFGVPTRRTADAASASDSHGIVQRAIEAIRSHFGWGLRIITDVCVCQYNTSGHCGLVTEGGKVDNDSTNRLLAGIAASHVRAGADIVAPSAMMDGQVKSIRTRLEDLDLNASILSYSAKHASSLYAPFRSAAFASDASRSIDKSTYQVSYANPRQAMREIEADIEEGADMVMIKPAMAYLDLIRMAKDRFNFPLAAQNVSGEYAMIKAASMMGLIDEEEWKVNSLAAIRRSGADRIISYFALDAASYL
jgi:porphobilinogen synthase